MPNYFSLKLLANFYAVQRTEQTHGLELRYIKTFYYFIIKSIIRHNVGFGLVDMAISANPKPRTRIPTLICYHLAS